MNLLYCIYSGSPGYTEYIKNIYGQRKFGNLTSVYTESCRQALKHRCLTAEMFYGADAGHEGVTGLRFNSTMEYIESQAYNLKRQ